MTTTAARVASLLAPARDTDTADAELVRQFVTDADCSAFGALVRRHGPMVFGVCRRVLRDWHLAEDAFQAAFLVLARRASAITPPGAVAGWLHGVAFRVSKDARRSALRRSGRERTVEDLPGAAAPECDSTDDADLREVIDDELRKLPAKYRELLVACDLEGQARQPVAESLGIPEGTLSSRLTTARKMLADRLAKRGIAPALVAGIATGGSVVEACEVPRALTASAARIGSDATGTVPAHVAALADGAIRAMSLRTFLPYAAGLLVAVFAAVGLGAWSAPPSSPPSLPSPPLALEPAAEPLAEAPAAGRLLIMREPGKMSLITPDGKTETPTFATERPGVVAARLSPDGKLGACNELTRDGGKDQFGPAGNTAVTLRTIGKEDAGNALAVKGQYACWSADGKQLVVVEGEQGKERVLRTNWVYDIATKEKQKIDAANSDAVRDWSPDGTFFLAVRQKVLGDARPPARPSVSAVILDRKGKFLRTLIEVPYDESDARLDARLSPDGKRALVVIPRAAQPGKPERNVLMVVGTDGGKAVEVKDLPENGTVTTACWSPDGKQIAFTWQQAFDKPAAATECESFLIVSDPDGKNQTTVTSMKATGRGAAARRGLGVYDWKAGASAPAKPEPKALAPRSSKLVVFRAGHLVLIDPDGKNEKKLTEKGEYHPSGALLSPDGKQIAVLIPGPLPPDDGTPGAKRRPMSLHVRGLDEKEPGTDLGVQCVTFVWSPDGTEIACSEFEDGSDKKPNATHFLVNVKTKKKTDLQVPGDHIITDWTRDGKYFVTTRASNDKDNPERRIFLWDRGGWHFLSATDEKQHGIFGRVSPDGKRILFQAITLPAKGKPDPSKRELAVVDRETKKVEKVADVPLNAEVQAYCWSPDGKKIAYTWRQRHEGKPEDVIEKETESHLVVCDPDGKNQKTILTEKGEGQWHVTLAGMDWQFVAAEKSDAEKLAGTWKIVSATAGKESDLSDGTLTFAKDKVTLKDGNRTSEVAYKLDTTKKPKWIDLAVDNDFNPGIYELDGDTLKICLNEKRDGKRPDKFVSEAGTPNDLLIVLKRDKP